MKKIISVMLFVGMTVSIYAQDLKCLKSQLTDLKHNEDNFRNNMVVNLFLGKKEFSNYQLIQEIFISDQVGTDTISVMNMKSEYKNIFLNCGFDIEDKINYNKILNKL